MALGRKRRRSVPVRQRARPGPARRTRFNGGMRSAVPRVRGSGGYFTDAIRRGAGAVYRFAKRNTPDGTFASLGTAAGGAISGNALGASLGGALGNTISKLVGFGDYKVHQNTLVSDIDMGTTVPSFGDMANGTVIRHREYIADIISPGNTGFNVTTYPVNPGLASVFPWLSSIAANYQQYIIRGMVFEYVSTSSDYVSTSALGSIVLSSEYDVTQPNYQNKTQMENSQFCVSGKPSTCIMHPIECDKRVTNNPIKYIRSAGVPSNDDARLYDWATLQLAIVGSPTAVSTGLGELWVSYDIILLKPVLTEGLVGSTILMDHFQLGNALSTTHYLSQDTTTTNKPTTASTMGGTTKTSTYSFPTFVTSGLFQVFWQATGGASSLTGTFTPTFVNAALKSLINGNSAGTLEGTAARTDAVQWLEMMVTVTGTNASFTLAGSANLPTGGSGDLFVSQIPLGMN
jgi:hypothetical protein